MGRTNIVLDDRLVSRARKVTGLRTKTAVVDFALRSLAGHETIRRIRKYRGSDIWAGDLNAMRRDRG